MKREFTVEESILYGGLLTRPGATPEAAPKPHHENGVAPGFTRRTVVVPKQAMHDLKALAYYRRESLRETMNSAVELYLETNAADLREALKIEARRSV